MNKLKNDIGFRNDFTNLIDKGKISSNIINFGDLYLIEEGIKKDLNKKVKKCELIFRKSLKIISIYRNFHKIYLYKPFYMIILIITSRGKSLGGFIDIPSEYVKNITNSFCFSFNTQKLFYNTKYEANDEGLFSGMAFTLNLVIVR